MPGWTVTGKRYDLGGSDEAGEEGYPFLKANVSSHNNKSGGLHNPILWFAMFSAIFSIRRYFLRI